MSTPLHRIVLNLVKQEQSDKSSLCLRRLGAGWSTGYFPKPLGLLSP